MTGDKKLKDTKIKYVMFDTENCEKLVVPMKYVDQIKLSSVVKEEQVYFFDNEMLIDTDKIAKHVYIVFKIKENKKIDNIDFEYTMSFQDSVNKKKKYENIIRLLEYRDIVALSFLNKDYEFLDEYVVEWNTDDMNINLNQQHYAYNSEGYNYFKMFIHNYSNK